jgi:mannose-6-phosphate isomerase
MIETRPWGSFEVLLDEPQYKVKRIIVEPGHQLSYQYHQFRAEHWTIVVGQAEVVLDDVVSSVAAGEHIYIPLGAKHRVKNPGTTPMVFIEVQSGTYFGEDDIVRLDDHYGRQ